MASYARNIEKWTSAGLQIVAIAVDSVQQNRSIVDKLLLPFPVLSDPDAVVIQQFGVYVDDKVQTVEGVEPEPGIARPAVFVVNRDATVGFQYVARDDLVWADRPLDEEIISVVSGDDDGQR